jgi:hypothetical protein
MNDELQEMWKEAILKYFIIPLSIFEYTEYKKAQITPEPRFVFHINILLSGD